MFGLSNGDTDQGYADIDFAFYTYPATGQLMVYEKGVYRGQFGAYAAGDTLRVSVESGVVKYWRKGVARLHERPGRPPSPCAWTPRSTPPARSCRTPPSPAPSSTWRSPPRPSSGRTPWASPSTGTTLTKTAATAWGNAGASSTRGIASGSDGYAEFTVPASPGYAMFGLSNGDTDQGYADIDFAFYTYPGTGQLMVYEKGVYRGRSAPTPPATSCASRSTPAS